MKTEYVPENNLVVLFLLFVVTGGLYYFWWLSRVSQIFGDSPVSNVLLVVLTMGTWSLYINLKYMQKSEELNGREIKWYMVFFLIISPLIIQHNINEKYFPGR
jgi:hypothetical protein